MYIYAHIHTYAQTIEQIWDTAGQERFRSMTSAFYNRAQGVILSFDVSQYQSFLSLDSWINDIKIYAPPECIIVLCANKTDLPIEQWQVKKEEYNKYAAGRLCTIFETSASTGTNVEDIFTEVATQILGKPRSGLKQIGGDSDGNTVNELVLFDNVNDNKKKSKKKKCCT